MTLDFRASQIRTSKIISSGSTGTGAKLLLYPIEAQGTPQNQGVINPALFGTGSIGNDVFLFVSGAINGTNRTDHGITLFGGDVYSSGSIRAEGDFGPHKKGSVVTSGSTPTLLWSSYLSASHTVQNIDLTIIAKQQDNINRARFRREFMVSRTTGSVSVDNDISVIVPDYQSTGSWSFSIVPSGSYLNVYVTGSLGTNILWSCRSVVDEITGN